MKHKYTISRIRDALDRFLDNTTCCRHDGLYLSIQWVSKGKRFFVLKHRSHVEYGHPNASRVGNGSATCNVFYCLYDQDNLPEGTLNQKNALYTAEGLRWCEAIEHQIDKVIESVYLQEAK